MTKPRFRCPFPQVFGVLLRRLLSAPSDGVFSLLRLIRTSRLHVGDAIFAPGAAGLAAPTGFSHGATELTSGFNWYLNGWVRVQFNYEHAWFDDTVRLAPGPAGLHNNTDTVYTRFQLIF